MKHYWIAFERLRRPSPLNLGCGITAYDFDDANRILSASILPREPELKVVCVKEIMGINELDSKHVLTNMGDVTKRGIWFPLGYP